MDRTCHHGALPLALMLLGTPTWAGEASSARLDKRCDKGQGAACAELAERWAQAPRQACEGGAVAACLGLAHAEQTSLGVEDPDRALDAYDRACFLGLDEACRRLAVVRALEADPDHPVAPLELHLSPQGIRIEGTRASFFSNMQLDGDAIVFPCTLDDGCERADDFDWQALDAALVRIAASDPSRSQAVIRAHGVQQGAVLVAMRSLAGPDGQRFLGVVVVEVAP
jgi:hypothetical protein